MPYTSKHGEVFVPNVTLTDYVLARADAAPPGATAFTDGPTGRAVAYSSLRSHISSVAAGLWQRGLRKGEVMAIFMPNHPEYFFAFHGAASIGAIVTTLNPVYTSSEIAHQMSDSGAVFIVTVRALLDKVDGAVAKGAPLRRVLVVDADDADEGAHPPRTPFGMLLCDGGSPPRVQIEPSRDTLVIPYSSGTSGLPKGVVLTHSNVVANLQQISANASLNNMSSDDVVLGVLPFFHIYGMVIVLNFALSRGAHIVTMPSFDPPLFLRLLKAHAVSILHAAPPIIGFLAKHPSVDAVLPLPRLREIMSGAAPLGPELASEAMRRLGLRELRQGYGMTEMSPVSHMMPLGRGGDCIGSIGELMPSMRCKVVAVDSGCEVGVGEVGELWLAGPNIMQGYLSSPEATASTIDAEGYAYDIARVHTRHGPCACSTRASPPSSRFLHTGDVGFVDTEGRYFVVDRVKELIKVKGFQVAPAELEAILLSDVRVADAAVIGLPDERSGELPKAYVVRQAAHPTLSAEQVKAYVAERTTAYKHLAHVEFVEAVPKSAAGKILRKDLRKMEDGRRNANGSARSRL